MCAHIKNLFFREQLHSWSISVEALGPKSPTVLLTFSFYENTLPLFLWWLRKGICGHMNFWQYDKNHSLKRFPEKHRSVSLHLKNKESSLLPLRWLFFSISPTWRSTIRSFHRADQCFHCSAFPINSTWHILSLRVKAEHANIMKEKNLIQRWKLCF